MTMRTFQVDPDRRTLHGSFSRDYEPILEVESGDTVVFRTLEAGWSLDRTGHCDSTGESKFQPRDPERDDGHALCGPIAVRGAEPGMTLEIQINAIRPGTWGWTCAGGWDHPVNRFFGIAGSDQTFEHLWHIDPAALTAVNSRGHKLHLRPFMGVMGMPPPESGIHSTGPPRIWGGNLDCKELIAGTSLFLPVPVPGGLFSVGDGHALQGDGEVSVTAIECPMDRVELTFHLHPSVDLSSPRARTPHAWLTLGISEDLEEAAHIATGEMVNLISSLYSVPQLEALALASLVVDLRITQIVNGVRGVHAVLRDDALGVPSSMRHPLLPDRSQP